MVPESQGHSATRSASQPSWPPSLRSAADRLRNRFPTSTGQLSPSVSTMVSTPAGRAPPCQNTKPKCNGGGRWWGAGERAVGGRRVQKEGSYPRAEDKTPGGGGCEGGPLTRPLQPHPPRAPIPPPLQTRAQASRDPRSPKFRFSKTVNLHTERVRGE